MGIDGDPMRVGLDTDGLETQTAHARTPAGGDEQLLTTQLAPVVELEHVVLAIASCCGRVCRENELDVLATQGLAERLAERCRLAPKHMLCHVDDDRLTAEPANSLRHL